MKTTKVALTGLYLLFTLLILSACSSPSTPPEITKQPESTTTSYKKDGLSLDYPSQWQLISDDSPSLYSYRDVGFKTSEFSTVNVSVTKDKNVPTQRLVETFLAELKLESRDGVSNFKREPITVGNLYGEVLTWTHKLIQSSNYELTIIKVRDNPRSVFVVFNLSDEDISMDNFTKETFLKSINYQ